MVLALPAVVALVLGAAHVQTQLADASRLSTIRDQLTVVHGSVTLAELVAGESVAAVADRPHRATILDRRIAEVDRVVAELRRAADFARLPADAAAALGDALGRLDTLHQPTGEQGRPADPVRVTAGYTQVVRGLAELVPMILAGDRSLDHDATAVRTLLLTRTALATEEALLRTRADGRLAPAVRTAAQQAVADEAVLVGLLDRDLPAIVSAAGDRRAVLANPATDPRGLLPGIAAEADVLDDLGTNLVEDVSGTVTERTHQVRAEALRDTAIVLGALLAALAIALAVARSLLRPIRVLRAAAHTAATEQLPGVVARVRAGELVDYRSIEPVPVHTGEEIGQLARAFDDMHQQAVKLAGEQAELWLQVSEMFMTLSRRSQSLVELQLDLIEGLESDEQDPQRLDELFKLDHLATRLRRNGENLQVLAGGTPARRGHGAVTVVELLRAATSEVNDYRRVTLGNAPSGSIRAVSAADIVHILAELLENAARFSPPDRKVVLTADRAADGGLLVEVIDAGLGMAPDDLAAANARLKADAAVGPETTRRMGLFVVSRLAARHGVTVRLRHTFENATQKGTTASVHVPDSLVVVEGMPEPRPEPESPTREFAPALAALATQPVPPMRTPIFDTLVSNWFAEPDSSARNWNTAADEAWRAAAAAANRPVSEATTAVGLPMRRPGERAVPPGPDSPTASVTDVRDAETVRHNLSRHYRGLRAARERATTRTDAGDES